MMSDERDAILSMSVIPPDLKAIATRLVKTYGSDPDGLLIGAIAGALYGEREACARIALAIDSGRGNEKEIAAAIRRPHDPS